MPDERYTRCPACATVFRVTSEQLAVRDGRVRCGNCKTVFDGNEQRFVLAPEPKPDFVAPSAEAPAKFVPFAAEATPVSDTSTPDAPAEIVPFAAEATPVSDTSTADAPAPAAAGATMPTVDERLPPAVIPAGPAVAVGRSITPIVHEDRLALPTPAKPRRLRAALYAVAIVVLALLLVAQAVFHFHDAIAAYWPATRPALDRVCNLAGCAIHPLRDAAMSYLSIEASDLQADPAHRGLLILTATVRNRAAWPLAYPHLELTLTDAQDRIVVRRALAPADYLGGTADLQAGLAPNAEVAVKVFIDASATSQAGYRLYMFYP